MNDRDRQFRELYEAERVDDQLGYFRTASRGHGRADERLIWVTAVLMFAAAAISAAIGYKGDDLPFSQVWVVLAAIVPGVSAAVAATRSLYEHERNRTRYENTRRDLERLSAATALPASLPDAEYRETLATYVSNVESLLSREHQQWVEVMKAIPRAQPPGDVEGG
jgi:hypothetical protein